jgi:CRISPR system Cascade subunit CasA
VVLTAGDRLEQIPHRIEPHAAWRRQAGKPKANQPPFLPVRHVAGRAAWRGLTPMLATLPEMSDEYASSLLLSQLNTLRGDYLEEDLPVQVLTVGVAYGNQSAVIEDVIVDQIPLPLAALRPDDPVRLVIDRVIEQAEGLRVAANRFGDDLRKASGGESLPWDKGLRLGDALMHEFNTVVRRLLAGLQRHPDMYEQAEEAWRTRARELALDAANIALSTVPPTAFLGREKEEGEGKNKKMKPYRASLAEAWFRGAVRNILGTEFDQEAAGVPA